MEILIHHLIKVMLFLMELKELNNVKSNAYSQNIEIDGEIQT